MEPPSFRSIALPFPKQNDGSLGVGGGGMPCDLRVEGVTVGRAGRGGEAGGLGATSATQGTGGEKSQCGKERWGRILVVVRSPCQENYPADAHPSAHKSELESANQAWTRSVHLDAPGQRHGQQPVSGTADPGVAPKLPGTPAHTQGRMIQTPKPLQTVDTHTNTHARTHAHTHTQIHSNLHHVHVFQAPNPIHASNDIHNTHNDPQHSQ